MVDPIIGWLAIALAIRPADFLVAAVPSLIEILRGSDISRPAGHYHDVDSGALGQLG